MSYWDSTNLTRIETLKFLSDAWMFLEAGRYCRQ